MSVVPVQDAVPPRSEQSNDVLTCWLSVYVSPVSGCEASSDGAVVSTADWKLTALLKL